MSNIRNDIYEDEFGRKHVALQKLSQGGQGVIYKTQEPGVLLKLELNSDAQENLKNYKNNDKFEYVRTLPLIEKTNLTLPQSILKNVSGYTMKMLDDMDSFENTFEKKSSNKMENEKLSENKWLQEIIKNNPEVGNELSIYISSGGLRKRIAAYLKAACIIAKIHASGLVYCDISDKNMFVSTDKDRSNVWLIDCDNLNYTSDISSKGEGGWRTPWFGAPEVVLGNANTMYSDIYSFAIALFLTLTKHHPFNGNAIQEVFENEFGDDFIDVSDVSEEEIACSGNIPWIFDRVDQSNRVEQSLPCENFISDVIYNCLDATFSEEARMNRSKRVTMPEWGFVLASELDCIVRCENCKMDYFANNNDLCPWCDKKNKVIKIISKKICNGECIKQWKFIHERWDKTIDVPLRILRGFRSDELDEIAFKVRYYDESIQISRLSNKYDLFIDLDGKEEKEESETIKFDINSNIDVYIEDKDKSTRYKVEIEVF